MCKQIRTIDKSRLIRCLGRLDEYEMEEVEEALSVRLGCFDDSLSINVELPNVAVKLPALAVEI